MVWIEIIKIVFPAILIIMGWWLVHFLTKSREKEKELVQDARNKLNSVLALAREVRVSSSEVFSLSPDGNGEKKSKIATLRYQVETLNSEFSILTNCHPVFKDSSGAFNEFKQSMTTCNQYTNAESAPLKLDDNIHYDVLMKLMALSSVLEDVYHKNFIAK